MVILVWLFSIRDQHKVATLVSLFNTGTRNVIPWQYPQALAEDHAKRVKMAAEVACLSKTLWVRSFYQIPRNKMTSIYFLGDHERYRARHSRSHCAPPVTNVRGV